MLAKWHAPAAIVNECQISWYPNVRGHGFGFSVASTGIPTVYRMPPANSNTSAAVLIPSTSTGSVTTADQPRIG